MKIELRETKPLTKTGASIVWFLVGMWFGMFLVFWDKGF